MSIPPSVADLPLPQWAYLPGESEDDAADHDTLWRAKVLVPSRFHDYVPARHPALRYGLALNNHGYFWESQEILEAVWAAAPQGGRERTCFAPASRSPTPIWASHAEAARGGALVRRGACRARCAQRPSGRARPAPDLPMTFQAPRWRRCSGPNWRSRRSARRLDRYRIRQPDMKQNSVFWRFWLDRC